MQINNGMNVIGTDGEKAGEVDRVVIDPRSGEVTHIVVRRGFLFPEDKVIPIDVVSRTAGDELMLTITAEEAKEMPDFTEVHYVPLDDSELGRYDYSPGLAQPYFWYPGAGAAPFTWGAGYAGGYPTYGPYSYPYKAYAEENIPDNTIPLKEGADVKGRDGKTIGSVEKIITENKKDRVTHLVVTKGMLNKEKKLIPAGWIDQVKEDSVQLSVSADFVDRLRDYQD